ncbi:hypothetical protein EP47_07765 [Legionella norrlandica]|uniref:DUF2145 domain-containing protein n=1 Tax=Legionella norrlandica TaxID=1498499 RepID=A0A0A2ST76_9GAMM|nr:DUF2145 domain-containing protein [Legionella norrlandica]KGP62891.1 hypothetical protein EP47_07765 [Legionella norrlandica]
MKEFKYCLLGLIILFSTTAQAGTTCTQNQFKPELFINASRSALAIQKDLNRSAATVALIARVGSNLQKYGLHYSHIGFAVKNYPGRPGQWTVLHLLNECGTTNSSLYAQGLMNFFMDNLYSMDYQIMIPDTATQNKVKTMLMPDTVKQMHNSHYNMIAYPFSAKYQNSNQWILEVIAISLNPNTPHSHTAAQHYLLKTGYRPSLIHINPMEKIGASMFNKHIAFDDHPFAEQKSHNFSTVTVISIENYLKKRNVLQKIINK